MKSLLQVSLLGIVCIAGSSKTLAVSIDYSVEGGAASSDNPTRTQTKVSDDVFLLTGILNVTDNSSFNELDFSSSVRYLDYKNDTIDDTTLANLDLTSRWSIIDQSFYWVANGFYGQQLINAFAAATPNNLQNIGQFSTGPDAILRITNADSLALSYRYTDFYAESTPGLVSADYVSNRVSAALSRRISPILVVSLNTSYDQTRYDLDTNNDFDDTRYSIALSGRSVSTQYNVALGQINIEFEDGSEVDATSKSFDITRQLNRNNTISLQLLRNLDTGADSVNANPNNTQVTNDLILTEQGVINYNSTIGELTLDLGVLYSDQDYRTQNDLDRTTERGSISLTYGSPVNLRYGLAYIYENTDFYSTVPRREDTDTTITARLEKRLTGRLNLVFQYEDYSRDSTSATQDGISETRYILSLRYADRI